MLPEGFPFHQFNPLYIFADLEKSSLDKNQLAKSLIKHNITRTQFVLLFLYSHVQSIWSVVHYYLCDHINVVLYLKKNANDSHIIQYKPSISFSSISEFLIIQLLPTTNYNSDQGYNLIIMVLHVLIITLIIIIISITWRRFCQGIQNMKVFLSGSAETRRGFCPGSGVCQFEQRRFCPEGILSGY